MWLFTSPYWQRYTFRYFVHGAIAGAGLSIKVKLSPSQVIILLWRDIQVNNIVHLISEPFDAPLVWRRWPASLCFHPIFGGSKVHRSILKSTGTSSLRPFVQLGGMTSQKARYFEGFLTRSKEDRRGKFFPRKLRPLRISTECRVPFTWFQRLVYLQVLCAKRISQLIPWYLPKHLSLCFKNILNSLPLDFEPDHDDMFWFWREIYTRVCFIVWEFLTGYSLVLQTPNKVTRSGLENSAEFVTTWKKVG